MSLSKIDQSEYLASIPPALEAITKIAEHCAEGAAALDLDTEAFPIAQCIVKASLIAQNVMNQCVSDGIPITADQPVPLTTNPGQEFKEAMFAAARFGRIAGYLARTHESWNLAVDGAENAQAVGDALLSNNGYKELERMSLTVQQSYRNVHSTTGTGTGLPFER